MPGCLVKDTTISVFDIANTGPVIRTASRRLPVFDVLRAAAALLVFLFHYNGFASPLTAGPSWMEGFEWVAARLGSLGTNLLLLLSGYFIANSMGSGRFSYFRFVVLRLMRIYLPYLLVLFLTVGFALILPQYSRLYWNKISWDYILSQLLLLPGLFPERPILTVSWTLSYIVTGYLLLPLLFVVSGKLKCTRERQVALWSVAVAVSFAMGAAGMFSTRFTYIPMGCLLYLLQAGLQKGKQGAYLLRSILAVGALALTVRVLLDGNPDAIGSPALYRGAFNASGLLTVSSAIAASLILQRRYDLLHILPWLSHVASFGRAGYSFYLLHGAVIKLFVLVVFPRLTAWKAPAIVYWGVMPGCWLLAAAAASLLYIHVERPLRDRLMRGRQPSAAPANAAAPVEEFEFATEMGPHKPSSVL
jgi:peptidoglycan/LPS O-acetylase OafA/YrhL